MMRFVAIVVLSLCAVVLSAPVRAADSDKVKHAAKQTGGTMEHGAKSVGHGAAKIFHDAAHGVHKVIAKNSHSKRGKRSHLKRAAKNRKYAHKETHKAKGEMGAAEKHADKAAK